MTILEWPSLSTQRGFLPPEWTLLMLNIRCSLYWKIRNLSHQVTRSTLCYFVCVGEGSINPWKITGWLACACPGWIHNPENKTSILCLQWIGMLSMAIKPSCELKYFPFIFLHSLPLSHHFPNKHLVFMKQKQNASFLRRCSFLCFSVITVLWGRLWMQRHRRNDANCAHPASHITYYFRHRNCNYEFKNASICLAILGLTNV